MFVTCLCAAWCLTCEDYRQTFSDVGKLFPDVRFRWVDIEDEAALVDDVDVVNFPTLLIADGRAVLFFGAVMPQARVLEALIDAYRRNAVHLSALPQDVERLAERLRTRASGREPGGSGSAQPS